MSDEHGHGPPSVDPEKVKWIVRVLFAVCAAVVVADLFYMPTKKEHAHYGWEAWIGFHALYGFVSCVLLVVLAAQMRKLVMRDEDYYGDGPDEGEDA